MVEPYISIISPGSSTPTLTASAAASIVPTITGVPAASPVSSAARARHRASNLGRPGEIGQAIELDDVGRERRAPIGASAR